MTEMIGSEKDLAAMVETYGFLPLLKNSIPGFSVEEHTPPELWFADGVDGPWLCLWEVFQRQSRFHQPGVVPGFCQLPPGRL